MTTIVITKDEVVCDSQCTAGGMKSVVRKVKLLRTSSGTILAACAGEIDAMPLVCAQVLAGEKPSLPSDIDATVALVDAQRVLVVSDGKTWYEDDGSVFGSGGMAARAVMEYGGTALEAVRTACKVDLYSSGPVRRYARSELTGRV